MVDCYRYIACDLEADGLLGNFTKIHCLSTAEKVGNTYEVKTYTGEDIKNKILEFMADKYVQIVGHNWTGYDAHLLRIIYGIPFRVSKVIDTMLCYSIYIPNIRRSPRCPQSFGGKKVGKFSLAHLGYWLADQGVSVDGKLEHEEWGEYSEEMRKRCEGDALLTIKAFEYISKHPNYNRDENFFCHEHLFAYTLAEQERRGFRFDKEKAERLLEAAIKDQKEAEAVVHAALPLKVVCTGECKAIKTKSGAYTVAFRKYFDSLPGPTMRIEDFVGPFSKVEFVKANLNSPDQVKEILFSLGWEPDEWNLKKEDKGDGKKKLKKVDGEPVKTSPKITESSLASLGKGEMAESLSRYLQLKHRIGLLEGLLKNCRGGRVHGGGSPCGADTGRVTHRGIVNIPNFSSYLGPELRELFIADEGKILIGFDWSNLENVLAANFTHQYDGGKYANIVLNGDSHENTAKIISKIKGAEVKRSLGKKANYMLLYGARAKRLSADLELTFDQADKFQQAYWKNNSGLSALKERLAEESKSGYIWGIDGRPICVKGKVYAALNSYTQSAGGFLTKLLTNRIRLQDKDKILEMLLHYHDESQQQAKQEDVDEAIKIIREAEEYVNNYFEFTYPVKLDIKTGRNWKETH